MKSGPDALAREMNRLFEPMEDRMALVPEVIHQAHERIIGGRKVHSKEKILSAHKRDFHTLVRRKAGVAFSFVRGKNGFNACCSDFRGPMCVRMRLLMAFSSETALMGLSISKPDKALLENTGFRARLYANM